jgi:hypothetical protein
MSVFSPDDGLVGSAPRVHLGPCTFAKGTYTTYGRAGLTMDMLVYIYLADLVHFGVFLDTKWPLTFPSSGVHSSG